MQSNCAKHTESKLLDYIIIDDCLTISCVHPEWFSIALMHCDIRRADFTTKPCF